MKRFTKGNEDGQKEKEHIECLFCSKGFNSESAFEEHFSTEHEGHYEQWTDFMKLLTAQGGLEILAIFFE